jgi:hypothetical protein
MQIIAYILALRDWKSISLFHIFAAAYMADVDYDICTYKK